MDESDRISEEAFLMIKNQMEYNCKCGVCQWIFFHSNRKVIWEIMKDMEMTQSHGKLTR